MTPEYLEKLADMVDPEQLWRLPALTQIELVGTLREELDAGVALRRYASHLRQLNALIGTGKSLLITPISVSGQATMIVATPHEHVELLKQRGGK